MSQRTQEFGVRMALGASAGRIVRTVLAEGAVLCTLGAGAGLLGATTLTGAVRGLLYDVTPVDLLTVAGVAALVAGVALVAAGQPAWRGPGRSGSDAESRVRF
jgi:putative ABC transport system permease protein